MERTEKPLNPKDVSVSLGIGDSTLRKWCLALEAHDYFFSRTDNNRRVFFDKDMIVLRHLRQLVQVQNLSLENASLIVISKFREDASMVPNSENSVSLNRSPNELVKELMNHLEQQESFNKQLLERLDQQEKFNKQLVEQLNKQENYIRERMDKRDEMLMEAMRQSQETKMLILAAKEEQKKKKGLFSFFNKN